MRGGRLELACPPLQPPHHPLSGLPHRPYAHSVFATSCALNVPAQEEANTLWAYATMGRAPGAGLMKALEGRAEAVEGTFNAQNVANTLWLRVCFPFFAPIRKEVNWCSAGAYACALAQRLVSMDKPGCLNTANAAQLRQLHQFFVWCGVEPRLGEEEINDMQCLKEACPSAFEGTKPAQSAMQQQVSETLCHMGLAVEDEVRCPTSGYSINMLDNTLGVGGESRSCARTWVVQRFFGN